MKKRMASLLLALCLLAGLCPNLAVPARAAGISQSTYPYELLNGDGIYYSFKGMDMYDTDYIWAVGVMEWASIAKIPELYGWGSSDMYTVVLDADFARNSPTLRALDLSALRVSAEHPLPGLSGGESLTEVILPKGLTTLPNNCFQNCGKLTRVVLPEGLIAIPDYCFLYCSNLTAIDLPATVTSLGKNAFEQSGLTSIDLPDGLTSIGSSCFQTTQITELSIPASVKNFDFSVIANSRLNKVTFEGTDLSCIADWKYNPFPSRNAAVYVQPGTVLPDWLKDYSMVYTTGEETPQYRLIVPDSKEDGVIGLDGSSGNIDITNTGATALTGITVTADAKGTVGVPNKTTLAPGESAYFSFRSGSGLAAGAHTASVTINAKELAAPVTLKVNFSVKENISLSMSVNTLPCGSAAEGYQQRSAQTVTVTNTGSMTATLAQPATDSADFELGALSKTTLARGESATFTVRPKTGLKEGEYKGKITVTATATGVNAASVSLTAEFTVGTASFSVTPDSLDFGTAKQGYTPETKDVVIENKGSVPIVVRETTLTGDGFRFVAKVYDGGAQVGAGQSLTIIRVQPEAGLKDGTYTGALEIEVEGGQTTKIPLKFVVDGASPLSVSPDDLDFGKVQAGYQQPAAKTVTVTNSGKTSLTLQAPTSSSYVLGTLSKTTLAAGESATFTVQPKAGLEANSYPETISIKAGSSGSAGVRTHFIVDGKGSLSVSPASLDFGTENAGYQQPAAKTVTVTNNGTSSVTLQVPTSSSYVLGSLSRTTLAAGQTATFTVRPKAGLKDGSYSEQITVKAGQDDSVSVSVRFTVGKGPSATFVDVGEDDWFFADVEYVYEKGLMNGVGNRSFDPNGTTTRGQIVTILYRLEGEPAVSGRSGFADVGSGQYYANAVKWASDHEIVNGYSPTKFGPEDPITREQMAAILYRYAGYKHYDTSARTNLSKFMDAGRVSGYAVDAISWANSQGLINGVTSTTLQPQGSAIRAQAAAILHRFCENVRSNGASVTSSTPSASNMTAEEMCAKVVELVNQERAKVGLNPLSAMENLTAAANIRAKELETEFSHSRPDGSIYYTVLRQMNVSFQRPGENISYGHLTSEGVVERWMNSPVHRGNILYANYTHIGVGYDGDYWVQLFIG